jgi:hypothetical protein
MGLFVVGNARYLQSLAEGDRLSWTILVVTFVVLFPLLLWRMRKRDGE